MWVKDNMKNRVREDIGDLEIRRKKQEILAWVREYSPKLSPRDEKNLGVVIEDAIIDVYNTGFNDGYEKA